MEIKKEIGTKKRGEDPPSRREKNKMPERLGGGVYRKSSYIGRLIEQTGGKSGPIGLQFVAIPLLERIAEVDRHAFDPLEEERHEVAPGLIYKYRDRALFTITNRCNTYCRFCTRGRGVGVTLGQQGQYLKALSLTGTLSREHIDQALDYVRDCKDIREIIVSGGDPLTVNRDILEYVLEQISQMQKKDQIDLVRVGTRLPIVNPKAIKKWHYQVFGKLVNPRLMVHINHPAELTDETVRCLQRFRRDGGAVIMSQSVLLRGVNDRVEVLISLFRKIAKIGVVPYYLYQNDPVPWATRFTVPIKDAIRMWQEVRPNLSGVAATARFVIDTPGGYGKIPLPEGGAWSVDVDKGFIDFHGQSHQIES